MSANPPKISASNNNLVLENVLSSKNPAFAVITNFAALQLDWFFTK